MAKIENPNWIFYIPDEIAWNPNKTVSELNDIAIPYNEYEDSLWADSPTIRSKSWMKYIEYKGKKYNFVSEKIVEWKKYIAYRFRNKETKITKTIVDIDGNEIIEITDLKTYWINL